MEIRRRPEHDFKADHANLVSYLTHKLSLKSVQIWETFAEEKSHLFPTGFLAVKEEPQRAVFVHWLSIGELLELANAIFHKRLELTHVLGQNVKAAYQPSGKKTCCPLVVCFFKSFSCRLPVGEERNEDHERCGNGHDSPED